MLKDISEEEFREAAYNHLHNTGPLPLLSPACISKITDEGKKKIKDLEDLIVKKIKDSEMSFVIEREDYLKSNLDDDGNLNMGDVDTKKVCEFDDKINISRKDLKEWGIKKRKEIIFENQIPGKEIKVGDEVQYIPLANFPTVGEVVKIENDMVYFMEDGKGFPIENCIKSENTQMKVSGNSMSLCDEDGKNLQSLSILGDK